MNPKRLLKRIPAVLVMSLLSIAMFAQSSISGTVLDSSGSPVIGANVIVNGTLNGTTTDIDGRFTLANVPASAELFVSFIGYVSQTIPVGTRTVFEIVLADDADFLDEIVVVGYGVQKKTNLTGAVSMVESDVFESRPVQNVAQALQGQIPGLTMSVGNAGGALDSSLSISIRGGGTIGSGSSGNPLVLIDGIEGNMNTVNPNDIESVSVLKDAASASIYGARAAFGVILITTKSGKAGKTHVNYTGNVRFSEAIQVPKMANSMQFAQYFNAANINNGGGQVFNDEALERIQNYLDGKYTDPTTPEYYGTMVNPTNNRYNNYGGAFANTDWFKEFYKDWTPSQEHNLSISGGNEKITYLVSGNFLNQQGLIRHGEDRFKRYTLNARISAQLASWAKLNYSAKWTRQDYTKPNYLSGLFYHNIARRWPTCFTQDPNGHWAPEMEIIQLEEGGIYKDQKNWYTNQAQIVLEPVKDWHINLEGSFRQHAQRQHTEVLPIYGYDADNEPYLLTWSDDYSAGTSRVYEYRNMQDYFSTNLYSDYSRTIGGHYFRVMAGFNAELYKNDGLWGEGRNLITPTVPELNTTQSDKKVNNSASELALAGFFGRINYNYKERYMLEANLRYDGSSRFVGDKQWGLFPSVSAGWNVARESFWEDYVGTVSMLKFRGSWGQLGNNEVDNYYPFFQNMPTGVDNSSWLVDGKRGNTSSLPGIVSSVLTWETIESWDLGFDYAMFNNRFTGSFSYYNRYTYDMVGPAPTLSSILGASAPKVNNADMKSYGWELEVAWRDNIADFNYGARFVLSDNQRKILRYPNETGSLNDYYVGEKLGEIWGYTTVGIAQTQEQMDAHIAGNRPNWGSGWTAGDIMYADLNGDGIVNTGASTLEDHGDISVIGNSTPRFQFGLSLNAEWKGFDLSMFFQGVMKRDYWLSGPYFWGACTGMWQSCAFVDHLDYWTPENPNAYYPRPMFQQTKNQQVQTRYLQNAAYIRLKNLQLGYTLPNHLTKRAGMEMVRVYVSCDNLWTGSKISGVFDPETLGGDWGPGKLYPLQRTVSVGANINF